MFEGLNWKWAAKWAAVVIGVYLALLFVLSIAFPQSSFNLESGAQIVTLLINAAFFFLIFTPIFADRTRSERHWKITLAE